MMADVCHYSSNAACRTILMYSTGICPLAGQILPVGEDLLSENTTVEGDRVDEAKDKCMVCRRKQTWERAAHTSLHQSFMVLPS